MILRKIYLSFFLATIAILANAQEKIKINGRINDHKNGQPISFAHIYIPELSIGTASNLQGEFKFEIEKVDSLTVSAIGYENKVIYLKDSLYENRLDINVSMIPKAYELAEIKIRAYPTYSELKRGILEYEMTPEELNLDAAMKAFERNMAMLSRRTKALDRMDDKGGLSLSGPVTAIYNLFSRHAKNEKKYRKILLADETKKKVGERLNFEIITTLTGLKDENEIADFIEFCNFSDVFVLAATDMQLYKSIIERYKEYIHTKSLNLDLS